MLLVDTHLRTFSEIKRGTSLKPMQLHSYKVLLSFSNIMCTCNVFLCEPLWEEHFFAMEVDFDFNFNILMWTYTKPTRSILFLLFAQKEGGHIHQNVLIWPFLVERDKWTTELILSNVGNIWKQEELETKNCFPGLHFNVCARLCAWEKDVNTHETFEMRTLTLLKVLSNIFCKY